MTQDAIRDRLAHVGGAALVACVDEVVSVGQRGLSEPFAGAYVVGSVAGGDARVEVSDLDVLLVTGRPHPPRVLQATGEALADLAEGCPLRGMEAVVYERAVLRRPTHPLRYALNVNGGRTLRRLVSTGGDPAFWFLLDVAAAREHALAVLGPPAAAMIGAPAEADVLAALDESLRWHAETEGPGPDAVLNACRAWHWVEARRWVTKSAAGSWAREQSSAPPVVADALATRLAGSDADLDAGEVRTFLTRVSARVRAARELAGPSPATREGP